MLRAHLAVLALLALPSTAAAALPPGTTYESLLAAGHKLYVGGDAAGALAKYEEAKEAESGRAAAYYFIGAAKAKLGKPDEAIESFNTAATIAGEKDVALHAKALFAAAVAQESKGDWDAAYEAWNKYLGYAQTHTDAPTFADSAKSRTAAIERRRALAKEGEAIRGRADNKGDQK